MLGFCGFGSLRLPFLVLQVLQVGDAGCSSAVSHDNLLHLYIKMSETRTTIGCLQVIDWRGFIFVENILLLRIVKK